MRIYQKINETEDKAVYEYLWGDYKKPFTGLIEINKKKESASVLKVAEGDKRPLLAGQYALFTLSENNYPQKYTHTGA